MTKEKVDKNEEIFMRIGLDAFVNVDNDKNINWKDFFQLIDDENYAVINSNQIIEDKLKENHKWKP